MTTTNPTALQMDVLYAPIRQDLAEVEQILRAELSSRYPFVNELVQYGCLLGGKRLRPALLLLSAQACGEVTPPHRVLAAVVEMIHTATLIHDDVLDNALTRRHLATVNSRWDNEASVLLGDFLFTHAFYLASTLDTALACRWIGQATNTVCEGEIRQKGSRRDFGISEEEYLSIIDGKTAALCACSCRLGAHFALADGSLVERLAEFGRLLGVAFQVVDDVLDVAGEEHVMGKSLGTDLGQQKPTLPIIHLLKTAPSRDRERILDILHQQPVRPALLIPELQRFGSIEYSWKRARELAGEALGCLEGLPDTAATATLRQLPDFVVGREF